MNQKEKTELLIRRIYDKEVTIISYKVRNGFIGSGTVEKHIQRGTLSNDSIIELFHLFKDYYKDYDFKNEVTLTNETKK